MLTKEDCEFYFLSGSGLAELCVSGFPKIEQLMQESLAYLTPSVRKNFNLELVYFRIYLVYISFLSSVETEKFEVLFSGFQTWLKGYWYKNSFLFERIESKINEYRSKFIDGVLVLENGVAHFRSTSKIVNELLINAGFDINVGTINHLQLKQIFQIFEADYRAYKKHLERGVWIMSLSSEEREEEIYKFFYSDK